MMGDNPETVDNITSSLDIFSEVEHVLHLKIPNTLKNILIISGYECETIIAKIDDHLIEEIENFAKNDLINLIEKEDRPKYFGIYSNNTDLFKIMGGNKQILLMLIDYCRNKISKKFVSGKRGENLVASHKTLTNITNRTSNSSDTSVSKAINLTEENSLISKQIKSWVKYKADSSQWRVLSVELDNISINTSYISGNEGQLICKIICFCGAIYNIPKLGRKSNESSSKRWILSNFQTHILKKHLSNSAHKRDKSNPITTYLKPQIPITVPKIQIIENIRISSQEKEIQAGYSGHMMYKSNSESREMPIDTSNFEVEETSHEHQYKEEDIQNINACVQEEEDENKHHDIYTKNSTASITHDHPSEDILESVSISSSADNSTHFIENSSNKIQSKWATLKYQRMERIKRSRERYNYNQNVITNYFEIADKICEVIITQTDALETLLCNISDVTDGANNKDMDIKSEECKSYLNDFLNKLFANAFENSKRCSNKNEFDDTTKKIAIYLYFTGGRLLYETLYSNLKNSLPSISTLNRFLDKNRISVEEDNFDFEGLLKYLLKRNLPKVVWVSEDATRITGKIEYDKSRNQVLGFVLPLKKGMPQTNTFVATSASVIQSYFKSSNKASYAYVIMAQPMCIGAPSYCLAMYGTDNKFSNRDVSARWEHMKETAEHFGIKILGFASDGDTRLLKAMKTNSSLQYPPEGENLNYENWEWFQMDLNKSDTCYFQDSVHILTKLRTRLLKPNIILPIGQKVASVDHLHELIKITSKDKHLLTSSDLKAEDKMNFLSASRMCSIDVMEHLDKVRGSEGTILYLKMMHYILSSFLEDTVSLSDRVYRIWFVVFLLRIWKAYIKKSKEFTLKDNFISTNSYLCVELNAHMLIKLILLFKENKNDDIFPEMFYLPNFSSQICEKFFRTARSMTSTYSTVINFSLKDLIHRINRIRTINDIITEIGDQFLFPREEKKYAFLSSQNKLSEEELNHIDLKDCIDQALRDALSQSEKLGMIPETEDWINIDVLMKNCDKFSDEIEKDSEKDEADIDANIIDGVVDRTSIIFNDMPIQSLEVKDFSKEIPNPAEDSPYVKLKLESKSIVIKKSTLCWLLNESDGKISTDRLRRFYTSKKEQKKTNKIRCQTKKIKKEVIESTDSEVEEINVKDTVNNSTDTEHFSSSSSNEASPERYCINQINIEHYYAVYYEHQWYIGRVIEAINTDEYKLKFLKLELGVFIWPKTEDTATVNKKFIFYGPIKLKGNGPFELSRSDSININKKYKLAKKHFT